MKRLNTIVIVCSKIFEVCYWIADALMVLLLIGAFVMPERIASWIVSQDAGELNIQGMEIAVQAGNTGSIAPFSHALVIAAITGIVVCALMAMVFRNIYLIFRTARGTTWFSKGQTPFQPDNIRMVREIGIFCILIPVIQLVMSVIGMLVIRPESVEISVSMNGVVMGIIVLCLSQFFAYGTQLQEDVDGLV